MSSADGERSTSPSILTGLFREKKRKLLESTTPVKADKQTQVTYGDILDSYVYKRNRWDSSDVRPCTSLLKDIDFGLEKPCDPRNQEFSKLIAFEMDRVPEEKRTLTYSKILDFIRKVREEDSLKDVSLPSFSDSE